MRTCKLSLVQNRPRPRDEQSIQWTSDATKMRSPLLGCTTTINIVLFSLYTYAYLIGPRKATAIVGLGHDQFNICRLKSLMPYHKCYNFSVLLHKYMRFYNFVTTGSETPHVHWKGLGRYSGYRFWNRVSITYRSRDMAIFHAWNRSRELFPGHVTEVEFDAFIG